MGLGIYEQQKAFEEVKKLLSSECLLAHYDPNKELLLACDASPYGLGAMLFHCSEDGQEQPIAFASRTLAPAERNYSQLETEALSNCICSQKVSPLPLWSTPCYPIRPQAFATHL